MKRNWVTIDSRNKTHNLYWTSGVEKCLKHHPLTGAITLNDRRINNSSSNYKVESNKNQLTAITIDNIMGNTSFQVKQVVQEASMQEVVISTVVDLGIIYILHEVNKHFKNVHKHGNRVNV